MTAHFGHLLRTDRGYFSRAEAIDSGETDRTLATARREGLIVRLRRGMYASADVYNSTDDAGRHLLHAQAALAAQRGPVALTGPSAAALHGFALYQEDLSIVHLVRLDSGCSHRAAKINHHVVTQDIEDDLDVYGGVTAINPARAVWEVACRSSLEGGVVTADSALHQNPRLREDIEELQLRFAYFPGSRHGRLAVQDGGRQRRLAYPSGQPARRARGGRGALLPAAPSRASDVGAVPRQRAGGATGGGQRAAHRGASRRSLPVPGCCRARRATSWRSLREQAANNGTCCKWSMNASRRAMRRNLIA